MRFMSYKKAESATLGEWKRAVASYCCPLVPDEQLIVAFTQLVFKLQIVLQNASPER